MVGTESSILEAQVAGSARGAGRPKRVAMGLTYYSPYVSGLTNVARDVAEGLVGRGWQVTVVATRHDSQLPKDEILRGVRVLRTPTLVSLSKGVISPALPAVCAREIRRAGLGNLHLPMLEAGAIAALLRGRTPLVTTYQCDVTLPNSFMNRIIERTIDHSARLAIRASDRVAVTSLDYAASSRISTYLRGKAIEIPAPSLSRPRGAPTYRDGYGPHVGFLGRIVEEKGVPYLVSAFRRVAGPDWRLLLGGDYAQIAGGSTIDEVRAAAQADSRVRILGFIPDERIADFYASLDVFAFPSVNPLEAFGIAQVEAMLAGVPVVASGLPGVRQPILRTGFGRVAPPRDIEALGEALHEVVELPRETWAECQDRAIDQYALESILDEWERVLHAAVRDHPRATDASTTGAYHEH